MSIRAIPLIVGCLVVCCVPARAGIDAPAGPLPNFPVMLREADTLTIYEGLPHTMFEKAAFERERHLKKVFPVSAEYFYEKPLAVSVEDRRALIEAFRTTELFAPYRGGKLCGGFHADYMVEWKRGPLMIAQVLLCFGCHEARMVSGGKVQEMDMAMLGFDTLRLLLGKYRQERPLPTKEPPVTGKPGIDAPVRPLVDVKIPPPEIVVQPPKPEVAVPQR